MNSTDLLQRVDNLQQAGKIHNLQHVCGVLAVQMNQKFSIFLSKLYFQKNDKNQWIQFSFDKERVISVVRTFGDRVESYVKTYSMQFSGDGVNWTDYEQHGVKRVWIVYVKDVVKDDKR